MRKRNNHSNSPNYINAIYRYRYGSYAKKVNKIKSQYDSSSLSQVRSPEVIIKEDNSTINNDNNSTSHFLSISNSLNNSICSQSSKSIENIINDLDKQFLKMTSNNKNLLHLFIAKKDSQKPISYFTYKNLFLPYNHSIKTSIKFHELNDNNLSHIDLFSLNKKRSKIEETIPKDNKLFIRNKGILTKLKELIETKILPQYIASIDWNNNKGVLSYIRVHKNKRILRIGLGSNLDTIIKLELVDYTNGVVIPFAEIDNSNLDKNEEIIGMLNTIIDDIFNYGEKQD